MSTTVAQVTSGTNGSGGCYAEVAFAETPAAGDVLIFLAGVNHANASGINAGPGLTVLSDSGDLARVYYQEYQAGQNASWAFGAEGATVAVIAYDIDPGGPVASVLDEIPQWGGGTVNPAAEGQPSVATSASAGGGLAISFLCQIVEFTVSEGGSWSDLQAQTASDAFLYSATEAATASSAATADWVVDNGDTFNRWDGVTFVIRAFTGTDPPVPVTGGPQFADALSSVTLTGSPGFAAGHSGTVAWTAPPGTPPVTSGAGTDRATVASTGAPHALTTYEYTFTATQDDGQSVTATQAVTVAAPASFRAFGFPVDISLAQVQHTAQPYSDSPTASVAISTAAGSTLILCVVAEAGADTPLTLASVTDTGGNDWQYSAETVSQSPPANGSFYPLNGYYGFAAIAYVIDANPTGDGGSVTVTMNLPITPEGNSQLSVTVYEFRGVPPGSVPDAASSGADAFGGTIVQSAYTEGIVADALVVAASSNAGFSAVSTGYALGPQTGTIEGMPVSDTAYGIPASPGQQAVTLTGPFEEEMNGWCLLAIGNPSFEGIAWYGSNPLKRAADGTWQ